MIFNMSGCSSLLNFKIVGGTSAPLNPRENTIWVNTDTEITNFIFSVSKPKNPTEGMIWIKIGNSSSTEFNALKKNGVYLCPVSSEQYISDTWVHKSAKNYLNREWVDWIVYLYNLGDECTELTGGWETTIGSLFNTGSLTKSDSKMTFNVTAIEGGTNGGGESTLRMKNKIDLSNYNFVSFDFGEIANSAFQKTSIVISDGNTNVVGQTVSSAGTNKVDISSISGSYHVGVNVTITQWQDATVTISEILLEN